jgi:hypothetical protein
MKSKFNSDLTMNLKRLLLSAGCALLGVAATAPAQSLDRAVFSIGTTTTNAQGAKWAYLLWQPTDCQWNRAPVRGSSS